MQLISEIAGVKVTAHRLRRYSGTEIYQLTKDTQTSMRFGGWNDEKTFRDYLGLDPDVVKAVHLMIDHRLARLNGTKMYHLEKGQ